MNLQFDRSLEAQQNYVKKLKDILSYNPHKTACIVTYGCQQNVSDSEKIKGYLSEIGYAFIDDPMKADFVLYNTCAVREHAELKVYGNVGKLRQAKQKNPDMMIALCGCMMQQPTVQQHIKEKFRHVDLVFGPSLVSYLPQLMYQTLKEHSRVFERTEIPEIMEGVPVRRDENGKAWVTVMYGCNNFCSYCIVPHVRGRERSRKSEDIVAEVKELISLGYKDITLLGQNVNSYGKDIEGGEDFAALLEKICSLDGDFWLRFMTSHPKDCTHRLLDTMAKYPQICHQLHLPFQAGSDAVLRQMNRRYTREQYTELINYARKVMPDIVLTSDVIVGFPGETEEDFAQTLSLVEELKFDNLFTFIYSKRTGTPAATMDCQILPEVQKERFERLLALQTPICKECNDRLEGQTVSVFVEGVSKTSSDMLTGHTAGGKSISFVGDINHIGQIVPVKVTKAKTWFLLGEEK